MPGGSTYEQFLEPGPLTDMFPAVCYLHTYNIPIPLIFMFRNMLPMILTWLDIFSSLLWSKPCKTREFFYIKQPQHIVSNIKLRKSQFEGGTVSLAGQNQYGFELPSSCWWASNLSSTSLHHFMTLHTFMPYEYMMPYDPPCKLEVLWPQVMASHLHHYSWDTTGSSHMIMCELHWLLLSWTNLRPMATHYDWFPSSCWVQRVSIMTSLSDLLLYSPIVICSADPRFLSNQLVWWPWTLFFI